jgi:hypothetical protein
MPILLTPPSLEVVLQGLHESEIRCGIQHEPPSGGTTAWIDYGSRTEKATFYGTIVGDQEVWPAADRIAQREEQKSAGAEIQRAGKTTLAAIAQELEARGVRTPAGRDRWAPAQVSRLLAT